MKIYTRTGDAGSTGLFGGARVEKDDPRVEAYGTLDELCSVLGAALAAGPPAHVSSVLRRVQEELFQLGAELACTPGKESTLGIPLLDASAVEQLERAIDQASEPLPSLTAFVLPGGGQAGSLIHVARTVCRRAERRVLAAGRTTKIRPFCAVYLNRLADLLFVLARAANHSESVPDTPWRPRAPHPGVASTPRERPGRH